METLHQFLYSFNQTTQIKSKEKKFIVQIFEINGRVLMSANPLTTIVNVLRLKNICVLNQSSMLMI